ncbi:hypothetical protein [uncultured Ruegeria sp.]|uniref:hypothetical protein n=1 Tax=uncultured Ruegeria sp. TaxID=259304 RepID=UPI0026111492|nr:hypothetical protein [uncultured Ruegeria sp.]
MPPKRPRRQRKGDRLLSPDARKEEIACDHSLAPFDRLAIEMERKWGIDQLPALVSPETSTRYGHAIADLNAAIAKSEPAAVTACVQNCIKGLGVMDAEATAAGHQPATGEFWEYEFMPHDAMEAFRFAVMRDDAEWQTSKACRPDLRFFSMREVALALHHYCSRHPVGEVKDLFPGAQITKINEPSKPPVDWDAGGDPIPI